MLCKGAFIARIPNDEQAQSKIDEFKKQHGQLRMVGRHKDRKGQMAKVGRKLNSHGDLPWRLGSEIVIYRGEDGMTFRQFQSLQVGDLVEPSSPTHRRYVGSVGMVVAKKGKNLILAVIGGTYRWAPRTFFTLLETEKQCHFT